MTSRPPAVAGLFYPGDPDRLQTQVRDLLADVAVPVNIVPKALIAPHAGYVYSGRVAAAAFATLRTRSQTFTRVVLVGPAHYVPVRGIAAPTADAFETPLGSVPVDVEALSEIADLDFVVQDHAPHAPEHALEVELPFLQTVLPSFQVVPLVVGEVTPEDVAYVLRALWGGPETLVVISSDLSHYHSYETAQRLDLATAAAIEHGDWTSLGPDHACGCLAVAGLLVEAGRRGLSAKRLSLCNSGDTAGARDRVVGYGAWAFTHTA
jgi:AmmeMemoRadiSam system protein B